MGIGQRTPTFSILPRYARYQGVLFQPRAASSQPASHFPPLGHCRQCRSNGMLSHPTCIGSLKLRGRQRALAEQVEACPLQAERKMKIQKVKLNTLSRNDVVHLPLLPPRCTALTIKQPTLGAKTVQGHLRMIQNGIEIAWHDVGCLN